MKYIPNILSIIRIVCAGLLLVLTFVLTDFVMSPLFMAIYVLAGITDVIDGPIARKLNAATPFGANLDATADYTFILVLLGLVLPQLGLNATTIMLIFGFILLKIAAVIVGYIRYKQLMMIHSYAAKTGSALAFVVPMILYVTGIDINTLAIFVGTFVYLFLIEEIIIYIVMPEPKRDVTGLYEAIQTRKQLKAANGQ